METESSGQKKKSPRSPSWTLMTKSSASASKQAELLRKRRNKNQPEGEECDTHRGSRTEEGSGSHSPRFSRNSEAEVIDQSLCKDALDNLRQDLLSNVQAIDAKLDGVVSHIDNCFAKYADAFQEQMLDAWQLMYRDSSQQPDSPCPSLGKADHTIGETLGTNKPPQKPSCSPPGSPPGTPQYRSFAEKNNISPRNVMAEILENNQSDIMKRVSTSSHSHRRPSTTSIADRLNALPRMGTFDLSVNTEDVTRPRERSHVAKILWLYLEDPRLLPGGRSYVRILILIILASCCVNIVQTAESPPLNRLTQAVLTYTVDGILTMEIIVRFLVCPNRLSFWMYAHNLLDIVTGPLTLIARVTLPIVFPNDPDDAATDGTASMLLQAWMPLAQLLRLLRRFEGSYLIWTAANLASEALPVLLYVLLLILTFFASLLYAIEPRDVLGSLPEAWWFTVVTLGTVGYGDVTPTTPAGKATTCCLVIVSALYMAMPIGIVGHVFSEVWEDRKRLLLTQLARQRLKSLGYTAKDIPALFLSADINMDGNLDMNEFTDMMNKMQFDTSGKRAIELFKVFDVDGGGYIDDREFLSVLYPQAMVHIYGEEGNGQA